MVEAHKNRWDTQLAKMTIDSKFIELTADALIEYFYKVVKTEQDNRSHNKFIKSADNVSTKKMSEYVGALRDRLFIKFKTRNIH